MRNVYVYLDFCRYIFRITAAFVKAVEKEVKEEKIALAITSDLLRSDNISGFS
jgi:hypothetical protein